MNKTLIWTIIISLLCGFVYISSNILMPFVTSLILAYFISPLASKMESKFNLNRGVVSFILVFFIGIIFIAIWVVLIPIIYDQILNFIKFLPKDKNYFEQHVLSSVLSHIDADYKDTVNSIVNNVFAEISKSIVLFIDEIWKSGFVFVSAIIMVVLIPLMTFYFIRDWKNISEGVEKLVPVDRKNSFHRVVVDINNAISGFIRGQLNVSLILAIYYGIALSLINLNFGLFIGITTGILSFVPFLGLLGGFISASIVAILQFQSWKGFLLVVGVFIIGNIIESIIAPRLIGNKLGVNPVWIMFFVLLGGSLFGFIGILFAVPVGATMTVLVKFMIEKYYNSSLYKNPL